MKCCLYIHFVVSARVSDWFFYSILYHKTSKLVDSSQTGLQRRISLGLSFVLKSNNLTTLLKQTISSQPICINLKRVRRCLLDSQIHESSIFGQIFSCFYLSTSKWHLSSFNFIKLLRNHSIPMKLSCCNLFIRDSRFLSQAKNVLPSLKLHTSV